MGGTTLDGRSARYAFDGTYTDVFVTPEPSTFALFGAAGGPAKRKESVVKVAPGIFTD